MDYIHLFSHEETLLFLNVTQNLSSDIKRKIWNKVNDISEFPESRCPKSFSPGVQRLMATWKNKKKKVTLKDVNM